MMADLQQILRKPRPAASTAVCGETGRTVLIVDDEANVRHLMRRWLESRGYSVSVAPGADKALEVMAVTPTAVALCDLNMPGHDGLWLADRLRRDHPDTAVIIATGIDDAETAVETLRHGVVDCLTKPFERERLCEAVSRGIEWHRSACDSRRWRELLEGEMLTRQSHLEEVIASQFVDSDEALDILLATLTATNPEAYAHACRVSALSGGLARALDLSEPEIGTVERGALLHDLGKLAMPDALLRKPAPLTVEEQRLIRLHPRVGSALIEHVEYLVAPAAVVRDAQERLDGLGYPCGTRGNEVWLGARIVTVADAYDTMTRARVFRDAISPAAALQELRRCSGTQFDPRAVDALIAKVGSSASPMRA
jgi:response regulator RpfG family c-di-GMP phosphodiesterase